MRKALVAVIAISLLAGCRGTSPDQAKAADPLPQIKIMVGGIDITNTSSIALHLRLGFVHAGTIKHAGFKFGKWLDLGFYQLLLETPDHPVDG